MIRLLVLLFNFFVYSNSNPCEITNGFKKSGRIQFRQDVEADTQLFILPFIGNKLQIKDITIKSNEISSDMVNEYFRLDFKTLVLNKNYNLDKIKIDFIELLFTCTATLTSFTNTFLLYVTISDINNYSPEFVDLPYRFEIKELIPVGSIVYKKIRAIDNDLPNRPNSQISYSILPGPFSDYFEFPLSTNSQLAVAKLIHYDEFQKCVLTIKAEDHGIPSKSTMTTIEIQIIDVDDKDPIFTKTSYSGLISHNSFPGTFVNMSEEILAYDQDTGINAILKYMIDSDPGNLFDINPNNGKIFLKNPIPKGFKNGYSLIVKTSQINNPTRSNLATVNINIININEHMPVFDIDYYETSVREDAYYNSPVLTVHATDIDDNPIEYIMITNGDNPFVIDSKSGLIKLNRKLDYETQNVYTIEVAARDGKHSNSVNVKIKVLNVVDKAPVFDKVYYNFKIKSPNDVYIGQVHAIDSETTGNISYSINFINKNDSNLFCITKTGVLFICQQEQKIQNYAIINEIDGDDNQRITNSLFDKYEYVFFVEASIFANETNDILMNRVECRINIEFKILSESTRLTLAGHNMFFKDANTFYAFLAAISGVAFIMVLSVILMTWIKCQHKNKKCGGGLYSKTNSTTTNTNSSKNTITSDNSCSVSYRSGSKCIKNNNSTIINQWDEKGMNSIFYGSDIQSLKVESDKKKTVENSIDANNQIENLKSFEIQRVDCDLKDESKKSLSIYSINRSKSINRSLSSASSTSIPITSLSSSIATNNRTRTPSFSSIGISLAVDNTIAEEYEFPKEPLTINLETIIPQQQASLDSTIYKSELILPHINYNTEPIQNYLYDETNISLSVDVDVESDKSSSTTHVIANNNNNNNNYQQVTNKLNQIFQINELSKKKLKTFNNKSNCMTNTFSTVSSSSSNNTLIKNEFFFSNDNFN